MKLIDVLQSLSGDARTVARAMALLWAWRPRTAAYEFLRHLDAKTAAGKLYTQDNVKLAQDELKRAHLLDEHATRQGFWRLRDELRVALYRQVLDDTPVSELREALHGAEPYNPQGELYRWPLWDIATTVASVRLELLAGTKVADLEKIKLRVSRMHDWTAVVHAACFEGFDGALFERITPAWRWEFANYAVIGVCSSLRPDLIPAFRWTLSRLEADLGTMPPYLLLQIAEALLHAGERARVLSVLEADRSSPADALRAAVMVQDGRWLEGQAAFEAAFKKCQAETGARKRLFSPTLAWLYPLALLAQQTPKHLELAKKFCAGESGTRNPRPHEGWGVWVHAIAVRLGDATLDSTALHLMSSPGRHVSVHDVWRSLLRAWLGAETEGKSGGRKTVSVTGVTREDAVASLRKRLQACGFTWLDGQLAAAEAVFAGGDAPENFFVGGGQEAWRTVLSSLQALGAPTAWGADAASTRLIWAVHVDKRGGVDEIEPMEQKRGARGWSKPKAVALAKLAASTKLEPWDARVARAIRTDGYRSRSYVLDRAAAIVALIGHPAVVMHDTPDTTVDVVEGTPELEVAREGEGYVMRVTPQVRAGPAADSYDELYVDGEWKRERDELRYITVVRDSPQRIRVIRLSPAQRRAASA